MTTQAASPLNARDLENFYRTCHKLFGSLIHWVPEFYSDWSLVHCCTTQVWERFAIAQERPLVYPNTSPSPDTLEYVFQAARLDLAHWARFTMGQTVQNAVRGILETLPENSWDTPRNTLIDRLSFVSQRILIFPQENMPNDRDNYLHPIQAFSDLCGYAAKRLLRHKAILAFPMPIFRQQLDKIASLVPETHNWYLPPDILQEEEYLSEPIPEWFDDIQAGALALAYEEERGNSFVLDTALTISKAIVALSKALGASPPFPVLRNYLQHYYAKQNPAYEPYCNVKFFRVTVAFSWTSYDPEIPVKASSTSRPPPLAAPRSSPPPTSPAKVAGEAPSQPPAKVSTQVPPKAPTPPAEADGQAPSKPPTPRDQGKPSVNRIRVRRKLILPDDPLPGFPGGDPQE